MLTKEDVEYLKTWPSPEAGVSYYEQIVASTRADLDAATGTVKLFEKDQFKGGVDPAVVPDGSLLSEEWGRLIGDIERLQTVLSEQEETLLRLRLHP